MIKKFRYLIIILGFILGIFTIKTEATSYNYSIFKVDPDVKFYDYANIIADEKEKELISTIKESIEKYNSDMIILTDYLNNEITSESYALDFYDNNGFGKGEEHDGIILFINMDPNNRGYYIFPTGETTEIMTDARIEMTLDKMYDHMVSGNYVKAIEIYINTTNKYHSYRKYGPPFLWITTALIAFSMAYAALKKEKKKLNLINDKLEASQYFTDNIIDEQDDTLIDTKIRTYRHNRNSGSRSRRGGGFGGFSGGGGIRRSGGGRRF